jgi:hypothetical protein
MGNAISAVYIYLTLCALVALIGRNRKFGFWGYFFCSILLSPIIGALLVVASDSKYKQISSAPPRSG